ncbi:hypothetical protein KY289_027257 [Solanum tuberosum]|nr:hypothetical protein KY289_027257 [Solanum tuberosum]
MPMLLNHSQTWGCGPVSTNPTIEPPKITNISGRPPKARRNEAGETKNSRKLLRTGLAMTCSICHVRGHNKKWCPQREGVESSTRQSAPSPTASVRAEPTGSGRGWQTKGEKEDKKKTSLVALSAPPLPTAPTDFSASSSAPPTYHASSSIAGTTKRGRGKGRGNTSPEKRPRVMEIGVFQAANGFKPGMPSGKIYSTRQAKVTRSSDVTDDIGYTPSNTTKLKWNGKVAISTSKLHELRE